MEPINELLKASNAREENKKKKELQQVHEVVIVEDGKSWQQTQAEIALLKRENERRTAQLTILSSLVIPMLERIEARWDAEENF